MAHLTDAERDTLNAAHTILMSKLTEGEYWNLGWRHFKASDPCFDVYMFTPDDVQHSFLDGDTFADKVATGLQIVAEEAENREANREANRAAKIERLRLELLSLTGEAA